MQESTNPIEPVIWDATCGAIDAAASEQLRVFNDRALALYDVVPRQLAYMYAHLTLIRATKDLLGPTVTRESLESLAKLLEPEWARFQMAESVHLLNALVCSSLGNKEGLTVFERTPRLEHTVVATALVLRHLHRRTDYYREHVVGVLRRNPVPAEWGSPTSEGA